MERVNNKTDRELLEENNQMLREIVEFTRGAKEREDKDNMEDLFRNVIANLLSERISGVSKI